jgi:hypothetical protein
MAYSPFDDWKDQTRQMRHIMKDAIDHRSVLASR